MSPARRTDKPRRRKRAWAAPFVITAALSAGAACTVQQAPPPQQPQPQQQNAQPVQPAQPQPGAQPAETSEPGNQPGVITNPPPPASNLPDAPTSGGEVVVKKDGTCWFHYDAADCPENATCNPPPPKQVNCP